MDELTPEEWAIHAKWAERRYEAMRTFETEDGHPKRMRKQAVRDRRNYPGALNPKADGDLTLIRFMVQACGIPFEHAEAYVLKRMRKVVVRETSTNPPSLFGTHLDPTEFAVDLVQKHDDIYEALALARFINQASKGTPDAPFWNEVVRALRSAQFSKLKTAQRAEELDEEDQRKERVAAAIARKATLNTKD